VVHTYSNLSLQASLGQSSFEPGAHINLYASLAESGMPLGHRAQVWADVRRPDGSAGTLSLAEHQDGHFAANYTTTIPGVYQFRIRANGTTTRGEMFTREQTLSAGVWRGGDRPPSRGDEGRLCDLIKCLFERGGVIDAELEKRLRVLGIDIDRFRKCLSGFCESYHR
jgi:hypothetical protein